MSLTWLIKQSFVDYVIAAGGVIQTEGVARTDEGFVFPEAPDGSGFTGTVRFSAHGGMLSIALADPTLADVDGAVLLLVRADDGTRVALARLRPAWTQDGAKYDAQLTREGATFFDDFYPTGAELAPLRVAHQRPVRQIAIIGSGPAGCYTAQALRRLLPGARIVVFDRLPVPYGLIRYGIAPDHQGTKAVTKQFDRLFERDAVVFVGNVEIGREITFDDIRRSFDATVLATGLPHDRELSIPGAHLTGVIGSGAFTGHLNGHHSYAHQDYAPGTDVVVVGAGNVAIDVVRLLAKRASDLSGTDIHPRHMESTLAGGVKRIAVLSRSSLDDVKCDAAMIRELKSLSGVRFHIVANQHAITSPAAQAIIDLAEANVDDNPRLEISLRFEASPVEIVGGSIVEGIRFQDANGELTLKATSIISAIGFRDDPSETPVGPDVFTAGWAHFGPRGALPEARQDGRRAANAVVEFLAEAPDAPGKCGLDSILSRLSAPTDFAGWRRIDAAEIAAAPPDRVRLKFLALEDLLALARSNN